MKIDQDSAKVNFPPPLMLLLSVFAGWGMDYLYPTRLLEPPLNKIVGSILIALGVGMILYSSRLFKKFQTEIKPWKTTLRIITAGIYSFSRNPIYLAFVLIGLGFALVINSWWSLSFLVPFVLFLNNWVIRKEEVYLESKFGEEYLSYKAKVRRWI